VDQPAGLALGIAAALEPVLAKIVERLAGSEQVQITITRLWATATAALSGPRRRAI
jgi:hypothetical protein